MYVIFTDRLVPGRYVIRAEPTICGALLFPSVLLIYEGWMLARGCRHGNTRNVYLRE